MSGVTKKAWKKKTSKTKEFLERARKLPKVRCQERKENASWGSQNGRFQTFVHFEKQNQSLLELLTTQSLYLGEI